MKIVYICVGVIILVSIITYIIGTILEKRKEKVIKQINDSLSEIYKNEK